MNNEGKDHMRKNCTSITSHFKYPDLDNKANNILMCKDNKKMYQCPERYITLKKDRNVECIKSDFYKTRIIIN